MPQRTNDFQRLVYLVRVNLADGAVVTESKMLTDRITGRNREVDVCIEGHVGGHPVVVSVECRDQRRVADVTWVDALKTKHERLPTNALILASKKGFTPEARQVAKRYGIKTYSLSEVDAADILALIGIKGSLWAKSISMSVEKVVVRVLAAGDVAAQSVVVNPDNLIYSADGAIRGPVLEMVQAILESPRAFEPLLAQGLEEHVYFDLEWAPPRTQEGVPYFLQKIEPETLQEIASIKISGPCRFTIAEFGVTHGKLGAVSVSWGKAMLLGKELMFVASKDDGGVARVSVNVRPSSPATAED